MANNERELYIPRARNRQLGPNKPIKWNENPFTENSGGLIASNTTPEVPTTPPEVTTTTPEVPTPVPSEPEPTKTTTANQDWEKGELEVKDDGVYFTPPAEQVATAPPEIETVEGRLSGLLASESPYLTAARTRAKQEMNARGLLNSTMAGTAGEKAAIESALPIASQDAGYSQNRGLQAQQGEIQKGLYETQGDISSRLSAQAHEQEMAKQAVEMEWNKIDLQARMDVEFARMDENTKEVFNETINSISADYMKDYMEIMMNPNLTEGSRWVALETLTENTKQRYKVAGDIANVELEWDVPTKIETKPAAAATPAQTPASSTPAKTTSGATTWIPPKTEGWVSDQEKYGGWT